MASTQRPGMNLLPGISDSIGAVNRRLTELARLDMPVFISGEPGTEKAFAAKILHQLSDRGDKPLSKLSISWKLPNDLSARLRMCDGGTLIISLQREFPPDIQYTTLEISNDKAFADSLTGELVEADVRILITTSVPVDTLRNQISLLPELADLLGRYHLEIPPIRERTEDIPALVRYATQRAFETGRSMARGADAQVLALFRLWHWPGNAEDLLLVTAEAALNCTGELITLNDIPEEFLAAVPEDLVAQAREVRLPDRRGTTSSLIDHLPTPRPVAPQRSAPVAPTPAPDVPREPTPVPPELHEAFAEDETHEIPLRELEALMEKTPPTPTSPKPGETADIIGTAEEIDRSAQRMQRLVTLARRLNAQSRLVARQLEGPLAEKSGRDAAAREMADVLSEEALADALEHQLDDGLDSILGLRRQLAMLNKREHKAIQTVRDLYRRMILSGVDISGAIADDEMLHETEDLRRELVEMDSLIQRVSGRVAKLDFGDDDITSDSSETLPIRQEEIRAVNEALGRIEAEEDESTDKMPTVDPDATLPAQQAHNRPGEGI